MVHEAAAAQSIPDWISLLVVVPFGVIWLAFGWLSIKGFGIYCRIAEQPGNEDQLFNFNSIWWSTRYDHLAPELPAMRRQAGRLSAAVGLAFVWAICVLLIASFVYLA